MGKTGQDLLFKEFKVEEFTLILLMWDQTEGLKVLSSYPPEVFTNEELTLFNGSFPNPLFRSATTSFKISVTEVPAFRKIFFFYPMYITATKHVKNKANLNPLFYRGAPEPAGQFTVGFYIEESENVDATGVKAEEKPLWNTAICRRLVKAIGDLLTRVETNTLCITSDLDVSARYISLFFERIIEDLKRDKICSIEWKLYPKGIQPTEEDKYLYFDEFSFEIPDYDEWNTDSITISEATVPVMMIDLEAGGFMNKLKYAHVERILPYIDNFSNILAISMNSSVDVSIVANGISILHKSGIVKLTTMYHNENLYEYFGYEIKGDSLEKAVADAKEVIDCDISKEDLLNLFKTVTPVTTAAEFAFVNEEYEIDWEKFFRAGELFGILKFRPNLFLP